MKLDLNSLLVDLEGQEIPESNMGKLFANQLALSNKGNSIKLMEWAKSLYKGETIEINVEEKEVLKTFIESCEAMTNLAKEQFLNKIYAA